MNTFKTSATQNPTSNIQNPGLGSTRRSRMGIGRSALAVMLCLAFGFAAGAQSLTDAQLTQVRFDQMLGARISLDLSFRDENGKTVTLRDYFGGKPVVLVLGYYQCPMLCTLTFNGMVESMQDLKWSIGKEFTVVHVSIDPRETSALAAAKKANYLRRYGRSGAAAGWHFLTGDEAQIRKLADEVGFHYAYDSDVKQYAHPTGLVVLTPRGTVSKYLLGVAFSSNELYDALQGAADQKVGSPIEKLVLLCFHYSPLNGRYSQLILQVVRVLAVALLAAMAWFFIAIIRREHGNRPSSHVLDGALLETPEGRFAQQVGPRTADKALSGEPGARVVRGGNDTGPP